MPSSFADSRQRWSLTGSYQPQSQLLLASDSGAPVVSAVYDARSAHGADLAALAGTYEVTLYGNGRPTITYLATLGDSGGIDIAVVDEGRRAVEQHRIEAQRPQFVEPGVGGLDRRSRIDVEALTGGTGRADHAVDQRAIHAATQVDR